MQWQLHLVIRGLQHLGPNCTHTSRDPAGMHTYPLPHTFMDRCTGGLETCGRARGNPPDPLLPGQPLASLGTHTLESPQPAARHGCPYSAAPPRHAPCGKQCSNRRTSTPV